MIEFNHWDIYFKHLDVIMPSSLKKASTFNIQLIQNLAYCLKCGNASRN